MDGRDPDVEPRARDILASAAAFHGLAAALTELHGDVTMMLGLASFLAQHFSGDPELFETFVESVVDHPHFQ